MLKKLLINHKGYKILSESPIILISQYNSVSTKNVYLLKNELNKIDGLYSLVTQNKITQKILEKIGVEKKEVPVLQKGFLRKTPSINFFQRTNIKKRSCYDKLSNLFQGPTFLLGIDTIDQLLSIKIIMKNYPNFIFVGGIFKNRILSHYLVEKLVNLGDRPLQIRKDSAIFELIPFFLYKLQSMLLFNEILKCGFLNLINGYNKKNSLGFTE